MHSITKEKSEVTPNEFAQKIIDYTQIVPPLSNDSSEVAIPDHWTYTSEGSFPASTCLVSHGLFDLTFDRGPIAPNQWYRFARGYYSPQADAIQRIYEDVRGNGVMGLIAPKVVHNDGRNPFFMTKDFWTQETQDATFQAMLQHFMNWGWTTNASRSYKDEQDVIGLSIPGIPTFDLPTSVRGLERSVQNMLNSGQRYEIIGDYPQVEKYGPRIPVCYMVADTEEVGDERFGKHDGLSPYQLLIGLIAEHTNPKPKFQSIAYVLGEKMKTDGNIVPRHVGSMTALMLEYVYGTPAGVIKHESVYLVPQEDMDAGEKISLHNSLDNWKLQSPYIIRNHPKVF